MKLKRNYRIAQAALANVKAEEQPWAVVKEAWDAYPACPDSQMATLLKRFTAGQRAFVALNGLVAEVNNGGIHQYLWNSTGNPFQEALAGLKLVGAEAHLRLLKKVARLFPEPKVLQSRRRRQKALREIRAEETEKLHDDPFYELERRKRTCLAASQLAYLKKHQEEFILPAGEPEERIPLPRPGARDYRVAGKKIANLRGEKLHWALIQRLWDDYWEPLKRGKQEILDFLSGLSKGQRALVAIDILNKIVLQLSGFKHFLSSQAGADVMTSEVVAGFELLGVRVYADLLGRVLSVAGDLSELNRKMTDQTGILDVAKKAGDEAAIQVARRAWYIAFKDKREREDALDEQLEALTGEYKALLESKDQKIEPFIEAYFDAHRDEFVR